ncbi:MAG: mannose-1-phosphate guanylyltransferase [Deltaproteobacteria bacterium]|nr:mannose-1-phosphate guanylyltransferase [Deltaproteobacteria bacterium]
MTVLKNCSVGTFAKGLRAVGVIMAGGMGTRFWPLSQKEKPKQFLSLAGNSKSLIQLTVERVQAFIPEDGILVATGESLVEETLRHLPKAVVLAEPVGRNTAPCLGYAAVKVLNEVGDVPLVCLASDHVVDGVENLSRIYEEAAQIAAKEDVIITIGMKPVRPDTGLGYIQRGEQYAPAKSFAGHIYRVASFKEKPAFELARQYLASGEYYWNGGMFIVRPSVLLAALGKFMPEMAAVLEQIREAMCLADGSKQIKELFSSLQSISLDFAVCEKADNVLVMPGENFSWSDIGTWASWAEYVQTQFPQTEGNYGHQGSCFVQSENCAVLGKDRPVALVGVKDLVVVDSEHGILVCHREATQDVKFVVEHLAKLQRN